MEISAATIIPDEPAESPVMNTNAQQLNVLATPAVRRLAKELQVNRSILLEIFMDPSFNV